MRTATSADSGQRMLYATDTGTSVPGRDDPVAGRLAQVDGQRIPGEPLDAHRSGVTAAAYAGAVPGSPASGIVTT